MGATVADAAARHVFARAGARSMNHQTTPSTVEVRWSRTASFWVDAAAASFE